MTRDRISNRRPNLTQKLAWESASGSNHSILVTFGFKRDGIVIGGKPRFRVAEVFCADFKAGSDMHTEVMNACILLSRLFQHGDQPRSLLTSLHEGSLIQTIAKAAAEEDERE